MRTCHTVPGVLHSVTILLKLKLLRTGDSATSKGNSVKLKGKHPLNINDYQRRCNKFQGMHSLLISFVTNIHHQDVLRVLGDGAKFSPEMIDPGLAVVSKASVQLSTGCGESPSNTLELLGPA